MNTQRSTSAAIYPDVKRLLDEHNPADVSRSRFINQILHSYFDLGFHGLDLTPRERQAIFRLTVDYDVNWEIIQDAFDCSDHTITKIVQGEVNNDID